MTCESSSATCWRSAGGSLEEDVEHQAELVQLLIWAFSSVVLVFIVRIKLNMLAHRKQAACVNCCVTPLAVLALIEELDAAYGASPVNQRHARSCAALPPTCARVMPYK